MQLRNRRGMTGSNSNTISQRFLNGQNARNPLDTEKDKSLLAQEIAIRVQHVISHSNSKTNHIALIEFLRRVASPKSSDDNNASLEF